MAIRPTPRSEGGVSLEGRYLCEGSAKGYLYLCGGYFCSGTLAWPSDPPPDSRTGMVVVASRSTPRFADGYVRSGHQIHPPIGWRCRLALSPSLRIPGIYIYRPIQNPSLFFFKFSYFNPVRTMPSALTIPAEAPKHPFYFYPLWLERMLGHLTNAVV
jgi:hypothetical protein